MLFVSNVFIGISLVLFVCGTIGLVRFDGFYRRLLYAALIDTSGIIVLFLGLLLRQNTLFAALKVGFLILCIFCTSPIITHKLARSAYKSIHRGGVKEIDD